MGAKEAVSTMCKYFAAPRVSPAMWGVVHGAASSSTMGTGMPRDLVHHRSS